MAPSRSCKKCAPHMLLYSRGLSSRGMVVILGCCRLNFFYLFRFFCPFLLDFFFLILQLTGNLHPAFEWCGSSLGICMEQRCLCQRCAIPIVG